MMEHRHRRRRRTFALVDIEDHGKQCNIGLVYNINSHGAFILCTASPNVNKIIDICMSTPLEDSLLIPISGIVIHRNDNGFGLMFCEQNSPTRLLVDTLSGRYEELALSTSQGGKMKLKPESPRSINYGEPHEEY